ncbi:MAG: AMP-binding protein [Gulosibacter sp.]|uniref:AMP-binding protein n=1 Tax=Gulosibacter sp. TaxID=2817531 RepID=UPI003F8E6C5E
MVRELITVSADDPLAVMRALDDAMIGAGPAILPVPDEIAVQHIPLPQLPADAPEDVVAVIETSGSTAKPKRVMLTARALRASASATYERLDALAADRGINVDEAFPTRQWLLCLPAHYVAGLQVLARSLQAGTRPLVYTAEHFDVLYFEELAAKLDGERRYVSLVPVQLHRLVESVTSEEFSFVERERISARMGRFDGILVGGQSVPAHIVKTAREYGWPIVMTYGSSETAGGCVYNGVPLRGVSARLEDGEIWLAGPMLAAGYLDDPERNAATFVDADGQHWYRTSDAGTVDPAYDPETARGQVPTQRISVTGRMDNVIISGGIKVNLDEVERIVQRIPGFETAVAVAVPSEEWGQSVAIAVAGGAGTGPGAGTGTGAGTDAGAATDEAAADTGTETETEGEAEAADLATLRDATAGLGSAARTTRCIRLEELPRLASGKPDRVAITRLVAERP